MADKHSKQVRSYNMSRIRGKNTKPEIIVRKYLFSKGYRYRLHNKAIFGNPDIALAKYKTVIFVNGCFWHGHAGCKLFVLPKTNESYWVPKIERNINRDLNAQAILKESGWNVIIIWECELKGNKNGFTFENLHHNLQEHLNRLS
jgi:DNA mismatch endonuclease (patch repair protein)